MLTYEGENSFLEMLFRGNNVIVPAAGNFYLGLCNQAPDKLDTLASITSEPTNAGGYARQPISRDSSGWNVIDVINNETRILSITLNFAAAGTDFSASFTRAFLTNSLSGSTGILFGYSGSYSSPILLTDGQNQNVRFEFYP